MQKHMFNRIFKSIIIGFLLLSLGSVSTVSLAKRNHHYHVRISRRMSKKRHRKIHRGAIRLRKHHSSKRSSRFSNRQIRQNCSDIYRQTIQDVNNDRRKNRLPRLRLSHKLSKMGNERSHQLQIYFSHNTQNRENEAQYLLNRTHIKYKYYGENIASSPLGTITMLTVGPYNNPTDASSRYLRYYAKNGYQLANNINNASMYHDAGDNNGHRDNNLDRQFKRIGVGVSYNRHDKNFYIAMEFIG